MAEGPEELRALLGRRVRQDVEKASSYCFRTASYAFYSYGSVSIAKDLLRIGNPSARGQLDKALITLVTTTMLQDADTAESLIFAAARAKFGVWGCSAQLPSNHPVRRVHRLLTLAHDSIKSASTELFMALTRITAAADVMFEVPEGAAAPAGHLDFSRYTIDYALRCLGRGLSSAMVAYYYCVQAGERYGTGELDHD